MKNYVTTKTLDFRLKMRRFGRIISEKTRDFDWDIFSEHKDMIMKGIFWGISVSALLLSLYNVKAGRDMKKMASLNAIAASENTVVDTEAIENSLYSKLSTSIETSLGSQLDEYITNYISTGKVSEFFTSDTISVISKDVENEIISHLKESSSLNSSQEAIIREIIAEKTSEIDYSDIEEKIAASVRALGNSTNSDMAGLSKEISNEIASVVANLSGELNSSINSLSKSTDASLSELTTSVDANLASLSQSLLAEMDTRYATLSESINNNSDQIKSTNEEMDTKYSELSGSITNNYDEIKGILGDTDISGIADGTVTGAIGQTNSDLSSKNDLKLATDSNASIRFGVDADGNYGYIKAGADTVTPFKTSGEAVLVGTYSSSTTIDVSAYGATSADQFICSCMSTNPYCSVSLWNIASTGASAGYTPPSVSLNGDKLTITVASVTCVGYYGSYGANTMVKTTNLPTSIYFIG